MSKVSEEFTTERVDGVRTIPVAFSGNHVTALRTPYIPSKDDQEAVPNPGISSLCLSFALVSLYTGNISADF